MAKYVRAVYKVGGTTMIPLPPGVFRDEKQVIIELISYTEDLVANLRIRPYRKKPYKKSDDNSPGGIENIGRTRRSGQEERRIC